MRRFLLAAMLVLTLAAMPAQHCLGQNSKVDANRSVVVLYDNDVHCALDGYAKVAGLRDAIRDTAVVLLVSSGDYLQGNTAGAISKGQYVVDLMRAVDYDVVTLGNHEFDYKVPRLLELTRQLNADVVCANFVDLATGRKLFAPYVIKQAGPWKIAFIGAVTPSTMQSEKYAFFSDDGKPLYSLLPDRVYTLVQQAADEARRQGADFVVLLSHLGEDKTDENVDSHGLAANTRGIDVILDGHTHSLRPADTVLNLDGKPVPVTQTGYELANLGKMLISPSGTIILSMIPVASIAQLSSKVQKVNEKVKKEVDAATSKVVCHSDYVLQILDDAGEYLVRYAETNAGDLVTDAYRHALGADIALTNAGGLRNQLSAGDITYGDLIRLLPYDNFLTLVEAKGSTIVELLRRTTEKMSYDNGDFPQCSGLRYTVHTDVHSITDVEVLSPDGKYQPIDPDRIYRLVTIDYCVAGGGFAGVLEHCKVLQKTNIHYRDALDDYVRQVLKGKIGIDYAKPQGRITVKP